MIQKILVLSLLLLGAACAQAPEPEPTPTESIPPTPTQTPVIHTPTPLAPTETPTPIPLTDSDFSDLAEEACESLNFELLSITELNAALIDRYYMASESYQRAADLLADIEISEEFAPVATTFRTSLNELAEVYSTYREEYFNALHKIEDYEEAKYVATTVEGETLIFIDEWIKLDIDIELINRMWATEESFREAANTLGLKSCAAVDPIKDSN
jgi:hypothetical protein